MPMGEGMMWGMGLLMMLLWILFLALIVVGVVVLVRALGSRPGGGDAGGSSSALNILEERYARGEIDRDEFEERRRALRG